MSTEASRARMQRYQRHTKTQAFREIGRLASGNKKLPKLPQEQPPESPWVSSTGQIHG